jgi:hypothetical protein
MKHNCVIPGCRVQLDPSKLMCMPHWRLVPPEHQRAVMFSYKPGQTAADASQAWWDAQKAATAAVVARLPKKP